MNKHEWIYWTIAMFLVASGAYLVSNDTKLIGLILVACGAYSLGAKFENKK